MAKSNVRLDTILASSSPYMIVNAQETHCLNKNT